MTHRLEAPQRVLELNPRETLKRIGLRPRDAFCDIGAGTGLFTYAAAELTAGPVFAVDLSAEMREILAARNNARRVAIEDSAQRIPADCCDLVLLCTVLHELDDAPGMMEEIGRILKRSGTLAIIEFHKAPTPMGPPVPRRISEREAAALVGEAGFAPVDRFPLGENFYCLVCRRAGER